MNVKGALPHGAMTKIRQETRASEPAEFKSPDGRVMFTTPVVRVTETVCERYCETCGCWHTVRGIMGALLCPVCHRGWHESQEEFERRRALESALGGEQPA